MESPPEQSPVTTSGDAPLLLRGCRAGLALPALSRSLFDHSFRSPSPRAGECGQRSYRFPVQDLPEELVIYMLRFLDCQDLCRVRNQLLAGISKQSKEAQECHQTHVLVF